MKLYQPTPTEIDHLIQTGIAKYPQLTSRYQRAGKLLQSRALHYHDSQTELNPELVEGIEVSWHCDSQSRLDDTYDLDPSSCTCPDFHKGAGQANNRVYCKHLLAFFAYREILIHHLNQRLTGNLRFSNERRRAAQWPGTLLILDTDSRPRLLSFIDGHRFPRPICNVRLDKLQRQTPVTDLDLANFAHWLADARPMPQADTMALLDDDALAGARAQVIAQANNIEQIEAFDSAELVEVDAQIHTATNGANGNGHIFQSDVDYQHWLDTGELPAVRQQW